MSRVRAVLIGFLFGGLGLGWLLAVRAAFTGTQAEWAVSTDQPVVRWGALAIMLVCVILAFVPSRNEPDEENTPP